MMSAFYFEFACVVLCGAVDCLSPNCSGHGVCLRGECLCYPGYRGSDCSLSAVVADANDSVVCVRDCSQHGVFDFGTQTCLCQLGWTGRGCETGSFSLLQPFYTCHKTVILLIIIIIVAHRQRRPVATTRYVHRRAPCVPYFPLRSQKVR